MREFAPIQARRPSGPCPSAEDLAAYIDGNLDKAERAHVTEHLASCEDCYAVYTETLQFQLVSSPAEPEGVVDGEILRFPTPAPKRRVPLEWLSLAALLLVGVGGGTYFQFLASPHLATSPVAPSSLSGDPLWLGPTYRGEGGEEEAKVDEAAFRFGVQVLNLQTTLQTGKIRESQDVIARILNLLKPQPFTKDLYDRYAAITAALDTKDKRPAREFLPEASRLAKESRDVFDPTSLDLGQWVEAGRLSAMSGVPDFFQQAANRRFLRRLLWNDKLGLHEVKLDPATRASLDRVSDIISKSDLGRSDYDAIQRELEKILVVYYPM